MAKTKTKRGGRRPGAGRPPAEGAPRAVSFTLRCQEDQRDRWRLAAERDGVDLSEKVRELLDRWSAKVLGAG